MAQQGAQLDGAKFCCSICLDLLKEPVTIPCGHSYCMSCINNFWDGEDEKKIYSCPQCRQTFTPRPVLMKNTMLADLVEELKKTGLQAAAAAAAPADLCYAGPEDVACDFCTGRKLKAFKSCLNCPASYCEKHLQPHYDVAPLKKHKLVKPSKRLQENICSRHDEVMKMFCRTDKKCICYLCSVEEHKGHDTVSATAERTERQRELEVSRKKFQQRIQQGEKEMKVLKLELDNISRSADKAVENSEKIFTELIRLLQKRSSDVKQQIRSQQQTEVSRVKKRQVELQQEITELKKKEAKLEQLSKTENHTQFLQDYTPLSLSLPSRFRMPHSRLWPKVYSVDVEEAVSEAKCTLEDILNKTWSKQSLTIPEVDVLPSDQKAEPKTRAEFLQYSQQITLDPNTANKHLLLSERNRRATKRKTEKSYPYHADRFIHCWQVLSRESLTGRCYFEVEKDGRCAVAVTYKDIDFGETTIQSPFGDDDQSLALDCCQIMHVFRHNDNSTVIPGPGSSTVGVYLDHKAGILSFYSVSETMTLLHRVQTRFTQPLYAGLRFYKSPYESTAEFVKTKEEMW